MLILDLLSKPFIYGVTKGAQAALKGIETTGRAIISKVPGDTVVDRVGNIISGTVGNTTRMAGQGVLGGIESAGGYIDVVEAMARPVVRPFLNKKNNLLGWEVKSFTGEVLFTGMAGVGVLDGMRDAQIGLVNYGPATTSTGEALTPRLYNQQVKPKWTDNLGADGSLVLALHQLRR